MDLLKKLLLRTVTAVATVARRTPALFLAVVVVLNCAGMRSANNGVSAPEHRVKAAFVYKFGDYVEWPQEAFAAPNSPLVIGVVGADPVAEELARITAGRTIGGHPVVVRNLDYGEPLSGLHVVFIGQADRRRMAAAVQAIKGQPALTVTDSINGLALGSAINFVVVSDKVRFDIALASAEANRLKISSRLLAVARTVVEATP